MRRLSKEEAHLDFEFEKFRISAQGQNPEDWAFVLSPAFLELSRSYYELVGMIRETQGIEGPWVSQEPLRANLVEGSRVRRDVRLPCLSEVEELMCETCGTRLNRECEDCLAGHWSSVSLSTPGTEFP